MAKRKTDDVEVVAVTSFKHLDGYVRIGARFRLDAANADDLVALNMVHLVKPKEPVDG